MKFTIAKKEMYDALNKLAKIIPSMPAISTLAYIKLDVSNDEIILTGSNTSTSIQYSLQISEKNKIIEPGSLLLKYKELISIVKACDNDIVTFSTQKNNKIVLIKGTKAKFKLNSLEADEYPRIAFNITQTTPIDISGILLNRVLKMTSFSVSDLESTPILTGVNISSQNNQVTFIATNKKRAVRTILKNIPVPEFNVTIAKSDLDAAQIFFKELDNIKLYIDLRCIFIKAEHFVIKIQTLSGGYPDLRRVLMDKEGIVDLNVSSKDFITIINRAAILSDKDKNEICIECYKEDNSNNIKVFTTTNELGSFEENASEFVEFKEFNNEEGTTIAVNSKYITDALKTSDTPNVELKITGQNSPLYIYDYYDDIERLQLIMPCVIR